MSVLVTISGVDLAGKTTQLEMLERALRAQGRPCTRIWYRPGYSVALDRTRALIRRLRPDILPSPGRSVARDRAFSRPGVRVAWTAVAGLDALVHYGIQMRRHRSTTGVLLADRYVDDAVLDFSLRFPDLWPCIWARSLSAVAPPAQVAILLTIPWGEVNRRGSMKSEPFPDTEEERIRRFSAYSELSRTGRYVVIDASVTPEEVHDQIMRLVTIAIDAPSTEDASSVRARILAAAHDARPSR